MRELEALRQNMAELGAEALLVSHPANVRYLSGFSSPEDGRVLVTEDDALLITDGRYVAQAEEESRLSTEISPKDKTWLAHLAERTKVYKLAFEADHLTFDQVETLKDVLEHPPIPTKELVTSFRRVKRPDELDLIRQAAEIADAAFSHILDYMKAGMRELEVALELERFMRLEGAEGKSFEIIVASGVRSAMPHGVASQKVIETGDLVTLDFGAVVDGYHSDMTRAVAVGEISDELRAMFDAVLDAQEQALAAVAPGKDGKEIDALAREVLEGHGLAEHFSHGLGHGVGLAVHEGPSLSSRRSDTLEPHMTVTVEPGVYVPGRGGVRIEDLAVVTDTGAERLSKSDKSFVQV